MLLSFIHVSACVSWVTPRCADRSREQQMLEASWHSLSHTIMLNGSGLCKQWHRGENELCHYSILVSLQPYKRDCVSARGCFTLRSVRSSVYPDCLQSTEALWIRPAVSLPVRMNWRFFTHPHVLCQIMRAGGCGGRLVGLSVCIVQYLWSTLADVHSWFSHILRCPLKRFKWIWTVAFISY